MKAVAHGTVGPAVDDKGDRILAFVRIAHRHHHITGNRLAPRTFKVKALIIAELDCRQRISINMGDLANVIAIEKIQIGRRRQRAPGKNDALRANGKALNPAA